MIGIIIVILVIIIAYIYIYIYALRTLVVIIMTNHPRLGIRWGRPGSSPQPVATIITTISTVTFIIVSIMVTINVILIVLLLPRTSEEQWPMYTFVCVFIAYVSENLTCEPLCLLIFGLAASNPIKRMPRAGVLAF